VNKREIAPPGSAARFQNVHGADGIVEKLLSIFFGNCPASAWARAISARTDKSVNRRGQSLHRAARPRRAEQLTRKMLGPISLHREAAET